MKTKKCKGTHINNETNCLKKQVGSLGWEDPWKRTWQPTLVFLSGEFHGQRSLEGYSPWGCKESDTTEVTSHANMLSFLPFECCPIYMDYSIKWLVIF